MCDFNIYGHKYCFHDQWSLCFIFYTEETGFRDFSSLDSNMQKYDLLQNWLGIKCKTILCVPGSLLSIFAY